jgi:hypothetical protein
MGNSERRIAYASLWVLALAFGWIEASAVMYLREVSLEGPGQAGVQVTLVSLPSHLVALEMAREACTIVLLGAVAWLAGRRPADRAAAFLVSFGIWDLAYYATLRLVSGWPQSLNAWDILFLIPLPWVAPVWAPVTVATLFVVAGSYVFWTPVRERRYRAGDLAVLAVAALLTVASFLMEWRTAADHRVPERFPAWLFWAGVVLGTSWFLPLERRVARKSETPRPWLGVRVRPILREPIETTATLGSATAVKGAVTGERGTVDIERVASGYTEARRRLDALVQEAHKFGERFERLAHGLSAHPGRMIVGVPDEFIESPGEWDIVPSHPLPSIERLVWLTNEIRDVGATVEELRERLILLGRADLVEQPNGFFH